MSCLSAWERKGFGIGKNDYPFRLYLPEFSDQNTDMDGVLL
jgi:hypothetical protein